MVTLHRYNEPAVVTTCIGYVLACNARYMAAKACGDGRPHGTATFEGGVLGDELQVSRVATLLRQPSCYSTVQYSTYWYS
eukprot:SAG11_NODE_34384_length_272_cov_0.601156_1_plen_79_part_01